MSNYLSNEIKTIHYSDGNIQRVQIVRFSDFSRLNFLRPYHNPESFRLLCELYRDFIVPKYKKVLGTIILFRLDNDEIPFMSDFADYHIYDSLSIVSKVFKENIRNKNGALVFSNDSVKDYFHKLQSNGNLFVVKGDRSNISFLPVGNELGFLSESSKNNAVAVNSSFFIMDVLDCTTFFDHIGSPVGLCIKNGLILSPPLFGRESFLLKKDKTVIIKKVSLKDLTVEIDGSRFIDGVNATFYEKPYFRKTPKGKTDIIICGNKVVALNKNGGSVIPSAGFVIQTDERIISIVNELVTYSGMEDILFGIQVGNSVVINGTKTNRFISPFHNFKKLWTVPYPPSMYPLDYKKDRAPRTVLGCDMDGNGMLIWLEGAGKFGYKKGEGSCGASLSEVSDICINLGMHNGVNLDGGGSSQIIYDGKRYLDMSDRNPDTYDSKERAIPLGLIISN